MPLREGEVKWEELFECEKLGILARQKETAAKRDAADAQRREEAGEPRMAARLREQAEMYRRAATNYRKEKTVRQTFCRAGAGCKCARNSQVNR